MTTAPVQIDNKVAALLSATTGLYASANVNNGQGAQGEWPPQGDHDLFVLGVHEKVDELKDDAGMKVPCVSIQFEYEWKRSTSDPSFDPDKPSLIFRGEAFRVGLAIDSLNIKDGYKTGLRINLERFKGHLSKLLKKDKEQCVDVLSDYTAVKALLAGSARIAVAARIQYRESPGKVDPKNPTVTPKAFINKTEFILDNLS